jgi:alpha-glucosidase
LLDAGDDVLAWIREEGGERVLAAVNFASTPSPLDAAEGATLILSTDPGRREAGVTLAPSEGVLLRLP